MSHKILHQTTKSALVTVPLPESTKSYAVVPHKAVIQATLEALDKQGIKVLSEMYTEARDGRQANGHYQLAGGDREMSLKLIWQNSYDKSLPLVAAMGSHVIVCSNGLVVGELMEFKRRHTGTVLTEFEEDIKRYVGESSNIFKKMKEDRERMKEIEMSKKVTAELIGNMYINEELITATQLAVIKKEIQNPSFDYGVQDSLWNAYNAITVAYKEDHPSTHLKRHMDLHSYISKEFAI